MKAPENNIEHYSFIEKNKLSKKDYSHIGAYTCRASRVVNGAIRSKENLNKENQEFIKNLDLALNKISSANNLILYRDEIYDTLEEFLDDKENGDIIELAYYISTYKFNERNPKNGLQIEIHTKNFESHAKDISIIGKQSEQEVLFKRNTKFRIKGIEKKKVLLEEL